MHEYKLLEIMAIGFGLALTFGFITQKLGLSSIVGYLLAGFLIGPSSPGFIADTTLVFQLSEAGVILLMFGVGLHFKLDDLMSVKGVALPGAIIQSTIATVFTTFLTLKLGLNLQSALILGFGLAVASTVVLLRVLEDSDTVNTIHGHVAVGWLVVEDILTVLILVVLPSLSLILSDSDTTSGSINILKAISIALLRIALLWVIVMKGGGKIVPWILSKIVKTRSQELFTLAVLVIAFATAVLAAFVFQASFALGAFLGGMVVGKSKLSHQAGADILPLRDAFAVLFFLAVGMLFDFKFLIEYPALILICLIIVLLIKPLTALITVSVLGYSPKTSLTVAAGLAQVGEFSFILAQEAKRLNLAGNEVYNAIVVCSIISITLNPSLFSKIPSLENYLKSKRTLWNILNFNVARRGDKNKQFVQNILPVEDFKAQKNAIVVGYGPTGKQVVQALKEQNVKSIIVDINIDTINSLTAQGLSAIYGDSSQKEILFASGIKNANYLIITTPSLTSTLETATLASSLNHKTIILARARFLDYKENLKQAGVSQIAFEEAEVAKALTSLLLDDLENQSLLAAASQMNSQAIEEK
ncbi:MAG: cation:proton antiporter [Endomicrobium sp.]|jgi:CPA2 family monovalent cation:H+ antiporter-2|nr:cation:proton antiporter [Endomicrobium sp.]MDR2399703.1 cation:proton antiporter [Endomicrobium sp.]